LALAPGWTPVHFFIILEDMARRDYLTQTELMVMLAIVRLGEKAYAVPIATEILERSGREIATASVYAVLERLEDSKLVESELGEATATRGGRAKTYYRLTNTGLAQLRETRNALRQLWRGVPRLKGRTA
jgi:DNA-binding PadR family transcriptional regulator